mgnify:CR=1 FL=1
MYHKTHSFASLNAFSKLLLDYLAEKPALKVFYGNGPRLENFKDQIASKSTFPATNRAVLQVFQAISSPQEFINSPDTRNYFINRQCFSINFKHFKPFF